MKNKGLAVFFLVLFVIILTLSAIAHWSYPQGVTYPTGRMITNDRDNTIIGHESPEYAKSSSPPSNPLWVRIFQDYSFINYIAAIGFVVALIGLTSKYKTASVYNIKG